jgi:dipeptide/tripeptide permease
MRVRQLLALLSVPLVLFLERLIYYGCRALLVLFMTQPESSGGLGMDMSAAREAFASFTVAIALAPALGGVAGLVLGPRVALPVGLAIEVLGFGLLAVTGTGVGLYLALGTLALGQALFRPNLFAVLGQELADPDSNLRSAGSMLAYGAINVGALLAPMLFGALMRETGFGVAFGAITLVGAFALLLVGGFSAFAHSRAPPAPASYAPTWVPGILAVTALFTLPYLTHTLGSEMLLFARVEAAPEGLGLVLHSLNPAVIIVSSGLLSGLLVVLHFSRRKLPALSLLGCGAVFATLAAVPLLLGSGGPEGATLIAALVVGALAEVLVLPAALSRVSAGASPRVAALLLGVFFAWMGVLNQTVNAVSTSRGATPVLAVLTLASLGVAGVLLVLGRRWEQRLFAPAADPATPAPEVSIAR